MASKAELRVAAGLAVVSIGLGACSSSESSSPIVSSESVFPTQSDLRETSEPSLSPSPPALERIKVLEEKKKLKPGVDSITLYYAPQEGGKNIKAIKAKVCFDKAKIPDVFRVMSREKKPNPGWLVNKVYEPRQEVDENNCVEKTPVINLGPHDIEDVYLGFGNASNKDMTVIRFYTNEYNPTAKRLENMPVKLPVKLRDS